MFDYRDTLESVARLLANEVHLDREQIHLRQATKYYARSPDILIPRLFPFCTPSVAAMQRVEGCKVTDPDLPPGELRGNVPSASSGLCWLSLSGTAVRQGRFFMRTRTPAT